MFGTRSLRLAGPSQTRFFSTELKERLKVLIPGHQNRVKEIKTKFGKKSLGNVTVDMAYGGMRDVKGLIYETSLLDAQEGIEFRGYTIPECQKLLPKAAGGKEPLPEGLFWLLVTGEIPTEKQVHNLTEDLHRRSKLPAHVEPLLKSLPSDMHPMTAFSIGITAAQTDSLFAKAYAEGVNKKLYWEYALEDSLNLIARITRIAAVVFHNAYNKGKAVPDYRKDLDWAANFAHMLGFDDKKGFYDCMRMYQTIHSDHEGGNVSAHTTHLVGSALSDPYLSVAAGMNGLAGPLHGLANQEVLRWVQDLRTKLGNRDVTDAEVAQAVNDTLAAGRVIPGFGHAVLRKTDPRYTVQREFALAHLPDYPLFKLVSQLYHVVPPILTKLGKVQNPWPNVDAHSGVILQHYGLTQENFYTVLFGVSRTLGVTAALVWSRALGFPIERPKSLTTEWIEEYLKSNP